MKPLVGLGVAFAIGLACRAFGIPSPAPPVIVGALLVMAMTIGYVAVDRWIATHQAAHAMNCAGPSGQIAGSPPIDRLRAIEILALLVLCAAYLQGGLSKLLDWQSAVGEAAHFGLPFPPVTAAFTIALELGASVLVVSGRFRWLGALALAGFTFAANLVANRFWLLPPGQERFMAANGFFEHLGLVGGFLLVALYYGRRR